MSDGSKIEWLARPGTKPASWNPIRARNRETGKPGWFCIHASDGCRLCYAEAMNRRLGNGVAFKAQEAETVEIYLDEKALREPLRWRQPRTVFVCSMSDLFGEFVPAPFIQDVWATMAACPQHTFIVLTKRAERMRAFLSPDSPFRAFVTQKSAALSLAHQRGLDDWSWPLPNVWLGVSVEANRNRDRLTDLIHTPAAVRFCSAEPMLERIDLAPFLTPAFDGDRRRQKSLPILDWVIVGGESGAQARACELNDVARVLNDCGNAKVACFVKQLGRRPTAHGQPFPLRDAKGGDMAEWPEAFRVRQFPEPRT